MALTKEQKLKFIQNTKGHLPIDSDKWNDKEVDEQFAWAVCIPLGNRKRKNVANSYRIPFRFSL